MVFPTASGLSTVQTRLLQSPSRGLLSLDVGDTRVGVAVYRSGAPVSPFAVWTRHDSPSPSENRLGNHFPALCRQVLQLAHRISAAAVVIGLPIGFDNSMSPQARKTLHFAKFLESQNCILRGNTQVTLKQIAPIVFWPERLTTQKARLEMLKESTRTASRDIDAFAAAEILRDFLAALENPAAVEDEIYGGGAGIGRVISSSQRFNTTKQALHGEFTQVKDYRERQEMYSRKLKSRAIAKEKNDRKNNR